jgi:hypothetical protein
MSLKVDAEALKERSVGFRALERVRFTSRAAACRYTDYVTVKCVVPQPLNKFTPIATPDNHDYHAFLKLTMASKQTQQTQQQQQQAPKQKSAAETEAEKIREYIAK